MQAPEAVAPPRLEGLSLRPAPSWAPTEEDPDMAPPADLTEKFEIHWNSTIGEGAFSTVRECTEISTGEKFAIKIIDMRPLRIRRSFALTRVLREVTIMKSLEHDNIVKLKAMYHTKAVLWLVQELANGGELFQAIARLGPFPEVLARSVIRQVISAIKYLHDRGTVHRDIKPENIMLSFKGKVRPVPGMSLVDANPIVKLVDFGLAKMLGEEHSAAKTMLGTPQYIAPEVLLASHDHSRSYGFPVDCWSVGVVLYLVLAGRFPFEGSSESQQDSMFDGEDYTEFRIINGSFEFDPSEWGSISNAAKHLVCGLLTVDPSSRITMEQALTHPWITGVGAEGLAHIPDKPTFNQEFIAHTAAYFSMAGPPSGAISRSGSQSELRVSSGAAASNTGPPLSALTTPTPGPSPVVSHTNSHGSVSDLASPPPPLAPPSRDDLRVTFALEPARAPALSWPPPSTAPPIPNHHSMHSLHPHVPYPTIPSSHSASFPDSRSFPARSNSVHTEESGEVPLHYLHYTTDATGVITSISTPLLEQLGHKKSDLLGRHAALIVSPLSVDVFRMLEVTGSCLNTPVTMIHASGSTMELLMSAKSSRNTRGVITGFAMSLTQVEEVSEEPMINILDAKGVFVTASDSWVEWLGYTEDEVNGRKLTDFLTPSCRDNFSSVLLPAVRVTGSSSSVILQFVAKSGLILAAWVDIVATRRRGVVHRLEVTVTPLTADESASELLSEEDVDVGEGEGEEAEVWPPPVTRTLSQMSLGGDDDTVGPGVSLHTRAPS